MLSVSGLSKEYLPVAGSTSGIQLFCNLNFEVAQGELLAIVGQSGAGKSTLLHMLAALDAPSAGEIQVDGTSVSSLGMRQQADFRNRTIGYVWQAHYLLPEFTAAENVAMPLLARGEPHAVALGKAEALLAGVGLQQRTRNRAGELSGGEQQRVSLARALVTGPKLLLADEPTGNLDTTTGEAIFSLLLRLHRELGMTTVLVTHNTAFASRCDRTLVLREGVLAPLAAQAPVPLPFPIERVQ